MKSAFCCATCVDNIQVEEKKSIFIFHVKSPLFTMMMRVATKNLRKGYNKTSPLLLSVRTWQPENQ